MTSLPIRRLLLRPAVRQTGFLTGVDGLTNLVDYGFHVYLARSLVPGEFAAIQTINAALLVLLTAFAVLQPVVARYTVEASAAVDGAPIDRSIFRYYFWRGALVGTGLLLLAWLGRRAIAGWLNVPTTVLSVAAWAITVATTRPVVAGLLQGRRQFGAFGGIRLANALGRLGLAILLVSVLSRGLTGAVAALPLGGLVALLFGLTAAGWRIWQPAARLPDRFRRPGLLTLSAFLAYMAYMSLLSMDLIWANRLFSSGVAGDYATAVLMRRALALLPAAVIVVMYPRAVARVAQGQLPDRLLAQTAAVVFVPTLLLTAVFAILGEPIIRWTFGADYVGAASLLVGMGVAMGGFGLTAVWLNFYLATRPLPFVLAVVAVAITQYLLFGAFARSPNDIVAIFAASGWAVALWGALLYWFWLRPSLKPVPSPPAGLPDPD